MTLTEILTLLKSNTSRKEENKQWFEFKSAQKASELLNAIKNIFGSSLPGINECQVTITDKKEDKHGFSLSDKQYNKLKSAIQQPEEKFHDNDDINRAYKKFNAFILRLNCTCKFDFDSAEFTITLLDPSNTYLINKLKNVARGSEWDPINYNIILKRPYPTALNTFRKEYKQIEATQVPQNAQQPQKQNRHSEMGKSLPFHEDKGYKLAPFKYPTKAPYGPFANTTRAGDFPITQDALIDGKKKTYKWPSSEHAFHAQKIINLKSVLPANHSAQPTLTKMLDEILMHGESEYGPNAYTNLVTSHRQDLINHKLITQETAKNGKDFRLQLDEVVRNKTGKNDFKDFMRDVIKLKLEQHQNLKEIAMDMARQGIFPIEVSQYDSNWATGSDGAGKNWLGILILEEANKLLKKDEVKIDNPQAHYEGMQKDRVDLSHNHLVSHLDLKQQQGQQATYYPGNPVGKRLVIQNNTIIRYEFRRDINADNWEASGDPTQFSVLQNEYLKAHKGSPKAAIPNYKKGTKIEELTNWYNKLDKNNPPTAVSGKERIERESWSNRVDTLGNFIKNYDEYQKLIKVEQYNDPSKKPSSLLEGSIPDISFLSNKDIAKTTNGLQPIYMVAANQEKVGGAPYRTEYTGDAQEEGMQNRFAGAAALATFPGVAYQVEHNGDIYYTDEYKKLLKARGAIYASNVPGLDNQKCDQVLVAAPNLNYKNSKFFNKGKLNEDEYARQIYRMYNNAFLGISNAKKGQPIILTLPGAGVFLPFKDNPQTAKKAQIIQGLILKQVLLENADALKHHPLLASDKIRSSKVLQIAQDKLPTGFSNQEIQNGKKALQTIMTSQPQFGFGFFNLFKAESPKDDEKLKVMEAIKSIAKIAEWPISYHDKKGTLVEATFQMGGDTTLIIKEDKNTGEYYLQFRGDEKEKSKKGLALVDLINNRCPELRGDFKQDRKGKVSFNKEICDNILKAPALLKERTEEEKIQAKPNRNPNQN